MELRSIPAGILGSYYAARHSYGHYRSCAVSGVYSFHNSGNASTHDLRVKATALLRWSLARTIQRHPSLCYGVVEKTAESDAKLSQLRAIHWNDVIELRTVESQDGNADVVLAREIGIGHQHLFEAQCRKPAWKLIVLLHEKSTSHNPRVDILFICHHAIADGTGAAGFHKTLLQFLQTASSASESSLKTAWPYIVPEKIPNPRYVEDCFPFTHQPTHATKEADTIKNDPNQDAWTASPPSLQSKDDFSTLIHIISIPSSRIPIILAFCRRLRITITGLLHGLILIYLSQTIPTAQRFRAVTPYSMRRFTRIPDDEVVNHVSFVAHDWEQPLLGLLRTCTSGASGAANLNSNPVSGLNLEEQAIALVAKQFQDEIAEELAQVPVRGPTGLLEVSRIQDLDKFCEDGMKGKRSFTYELSNIGVVGIPKPEQSEVVESVNCAEAPKLPSVELEKLVFTQCGMVAGPAFGCSVISVRSGPMVVSLHWQGGVVEGGFMDGLKEFIEWKLMNLGDESL